MSERSFDSAPGPIEEPVDIFKAVDDTPTEADTARRHWRDDLWHLSPLPRLSP